jgi:predicted P-loop ATPase
MVEVSFNEAEDNLARKMRGKLVGEIAELKGLNSRDAESIKAFITRTHEKWIPKYREFESEYPRRILFIGTTNEEAFLADPSGARRYLPVRVGTIDVHAIRSIVELCWAEAAMFFAKHGIAWRQAESLARQEHDEFRIVDAWEEPIKQWLNDPLFGEEGDGGRELVTTTSVLTGAIGLDPKHINRREEMRAGSVLRNLGYARRKIRMGKVTKWAYVPNCSLAVL